MDRQTSFQSGFNRRFNQLMTMEKAAGKLNKGNAANVFGGTQMKKKTKPSPAAAVAPVKSAPAVPLVADPAPAPMKTTPPIAAPEAPKPGIAELLSKPAPSPEAAPQFAVPMSAPKTNVLPSLATSPLPIASPAAAPPMDAVGSFRERLREMIAKGSAGAAHGAYAAANNFNERQDAGSLLGKAKALIGKQASTKHAFFGRMAAKAAPYATRAFEGIGKQVSRLPGSAQGLLAGGKAAYPSTFGDIGKATAKRVGTVGGIGAGMYGSNLYGQHSAAEEARQRAAQASFMQRLMYLVNPSSVYNM